MLDVEQKKTSILQQSEIKDLSGGGSGLEYFSPAWKEAVTVRPEHTNLQMGDM